MVRGLGIALAFALVTGCVTPSIPIPPPDPDKMTFLFDVGTGDVTFSYTASANFGGATVYVFDRATGKGVIDTARNDGSVGPTPPFAASAGDQVDITFQLGDQAASLCVLIREGTPSSFCP
ncbi:MAG: hypothetical protein K8W52_08885 [Deltaproteobacteria bacterium]|nr:hypothetical protein [Deltaproteobacteria bacterium]